VLFLFNQCMHKIHLEQFEGPLDLLLQLIEKNKLHITEISLAKITDQYLEYIEKADNLASAEVADFLLIASKLIYLKSKYLLPDLAVDAAEEVGDLEHQLKIYREYYEASKIINKMYLDKKHYSYERLNPYKFDLPQEFLPPKNVNVSVLAKSFAVILSRIEHLVNLPKAVIARAISISEKIEEIKDLIRDKVKINFHKWLEKKDKMEVVVGFLAMLELVKQKEIVVRQDELFGELNIEKNNH